VCSVHLCCVPNPLDEVNAYFFGLVSQQFYRYWVCRTFIVGSAFWKRLTTSAGFKDGLFLKWASSSRHPLMYLATHTVSEPLLSFNTLLLLSKAYCEFPGVCLPCFWSTEMDTGCGISPTNYCKLLCSRSRYHHVKEFPVFCSPFFLHRNTNVGSVWYAHLVAHSSSLADLWEGPVNSICQLIIILLANIFLALR
jgi:hypothetical protein